MSKGVFINSNRLFVYGIFLSERNRRLYGMRNPEYATVRDYLTVGDVIVEAVKVKNAGLALTGLVVDMDPRKWESLDALEGGYNREIVTTTDGERVFMYVGK